MYYFYDPVKHPDVFVIHVQGYGAFDQEEVQHKNAFDVTYTPIHTGSVSLTAYGFHGGDLNKGDGYGTNDLLF